MDKDPGTPMKWMAREGLRFPTLAYPALKRGRGYISATREMYRALAPVSAEPELVPWLPAAAAVFGSDFLGHPPQELGPVLQEPPAG